MIRIENLTKRYGGRTILRGACLGAEAGGFVLLRGESGCGKSTLLRVIAGLEEDYEGSVYLCGKEADDLPPNRRGVSVVFQQAAIFSHMNVRQNIAFGVSRKDKAAQERVENLLDALEVRALQAKRPAQLSGGEAKRVAVARALAVDCPVYLFDEALTNLDPALKRRVFTVITEYTRGKTVLYVTHEEDLEEYKTYPTYTIQDGVFVKREEASR